MFSFILAEDHRMSTETSHTTSKIKWQWHYKIMVRMSVYGHTMVKCVLLISSDGRKSINMYITQKYQRRLVLVDHNDISNPVRLNIKEHVYIKTITDQTKQ